MSNESVEPFDYMKLMFCDAVIHFSGGPSQVGDSLGLSSGLNVSDSYSSFVCFSLTTSRITEMCGYLLRTCETFQARGLFGHRF